ncbi:MAG: dihydrofolate reductase [Candidatus Diapherotrites archaeon]|nr:dihydrofolate reductase [Candidatus Diapherotrites archaeon]
MAVNLIAAMTRARVIGKDNKLLWHIPQDLKNFRSLTEGHPVIMGRKTFESIGKPLPNRPNFVISRSMPETDGVTVCRSLSEALQNARALDEAVFVIGGGEIFAQALPLARRMYVSWVKAEFEGDAFFPKFNESEWVVTEKKDFGEFEFVVYERES